ncbi:MAG: protein translocase subunit SecD [Proteobacteria bacterium]|nr:protein translocase subunit SecD [Pseudomonadota bacterium]MBU1639489.1 protein translocase subunit SecD [Pseudomonadota bacterium]
MNKSLKWKFILLFCLVAYSAVALLPSVPSLSSGLPGWWKQYMAPEGLRRGLDLQGGLHVVLKVNLNKAIENALTFATDDLKTQLKEKKITVVKMASGDPHKVLFTLPNKSSLPEIKTIVKEDFTDLTMEVKEEGDFPRILISLSATRVNFINDNAVNQSLEIIRNRIDQFGVAEPVIIRQGKDEVIVQLPGEENPGRAKELIGQTAQLEFKLVDGPGTITLPTLIDQAVSAGKWQKGQDRSLLNAALKHQLPDDTEIYFEKSVDPDTKIKRDIPLLLKSQVLMTGEMVKDAQVRIGGNFNEPYVSLDLTGRGAKVFGDVTGNHINERLAIVLDGVVRSAPNIQSKILGGSAMITGSYAYEEANDLAIILRVGALPAPVDIVQELTVGASLGSDSIHKGVSSGLLGTALVFLFMIFYYRLSGVIANIALVLNILFVFTGLAALQATLTLPGIAGIILSIGMAVDSNVLIFERMREEFALGKSTRSGVEAGYDKAFWTIVDSQVTTLITALALFLFGTGPIKGFAVTLSLGVTFNLFTTLFATRLVYDFLYEKNLLKPLTFFEVFKRPNLDYMGLRKFTFIVSGVFLILGLVASVQLMRGQGNLGVDFAGGAMLQYKADKPFTLGEVRQVLTDYDLQPVHDGNRIIVKIKKSSDIVGSDATTVSKLLTDNLGDYNFTLESQSEIGSSVSTMLRNKAILAIFLSLAGVIFYLALRFDISFGIAAVVATLHDVIVILGICYLLNIEINLLLVTALLTLAGYSLNDTVIVFDRIRENMHKDTKMPFTQVINLSINEVLNRTFVASLTTAIVLVALFYLGGTVIHDFSFALLAGIIVGTYSSIFVASPALYLWRKS